MEVRLVKYAEHLIWGKGGDRTSRGEVGRFEDPFMPTDLFP